MKLFLGKHEYGILFDAFKRLTAIEKAIVCLSYVVLMMGAWWYGGILSQTLLGR